MTAAPLFPPLTYHRIRLQWCGAALWRLLRQWLVVLVIGLMLLGAFSVGATSSMAALVAWSVLGLFHAASQGLGQGLLAAGLHALVGAGVVLALRPVLWPVSWAQAEQALPLTQRERLASDAIVVALALLPLFVIYVAGAATWLMPPPAWLQEAKGTALLMLALSMALSHAAGMGVLYQLRHPVHRPPRHPHAASSVRVVHMLSRRQHPAWALVVWPLLRGPAQRSGRWLLGLTLVLLGLALMIARAHWQLAGVDGALWGLFLWSLLSMAGSSRLHALIQRELAPLHAACASLPLSPQHLRWARRGLGLLPLVLGLCVLPLALWLSAWPIRHTVEGLYLLASLLGHAWQFDADTPAEVTTPQVQSQNQTVRWVLTLVVLLALASEVFE
ncbi:MAG: hypothetical protein FD135_1741 [Comamonadaceae bacterium]|nr:MAG: hypothetical protein FD135_1741 [Comamonadaceae bacterium]